MVINNTDDTGKIVCPINEPTPRRAPSLQSPKGAPAHVALAQVEVRRGLLDEPLHLLRDGELLAELAAGQLVLDAADDAHGALVERLGLEGSGVLGGEQLLGLGSG